MRARIEADERDLLYKVYITDSVKLMGEGKYLTDRWYDRAFGKRVIDTRSADEIALDIITRAGLSFGEPLEEGE